MTFDLFMFLATLLMTVSSLWLFIAYVTTTDEYYQAFRPLMLPLTAFSTIINFLALIH